MYYVQLLNQVGIIPTQGDMTSIARKAEQLEDYEDTIVRCIPNLLLMTMTLFSELYMTSKRSGDTNVSSAIKICCLGCSLTNPILTTML